MTVKKDGRIIVLAAPSGTGKSTLLKRLQEDFPELKWSVSLTTRPKREGEVDGVHYKFVDVATFEEHIERNEFIEWAQVHQNYYGTLKSVVDKGLEAGDSILFELDVQGCDSMKDIYGDKAQVIFIEPPSVESLEERLIKRNTDSTGVIEIRLTNAKRELARKDDFDFNIVNDDIERAYSELSSIVRKILAAR